MDNGYAIETKNLVKRFGKKVVLDDLNLSVPQGSVFAFLGRNGAGKTTTIQILLNLLDRTSGEVGVLGLDPRKQDLELKKRIGYVAENQQMYPWMNVEQLCWFCKGFLPTWDDALEASLIKEMELPTKTKMRDMSRGTQAKVALLLAMAHRPELLILDEPTAGLDVLVRREFLEGVIDLIQQEGRTVFFSTHLVHEVERIADWVGVIDEGHLLLACPLEELKAKVKRLVLTFSETAPEHIQMEGVLETKHSQRQLIVTVRDCSESAMTTARSTGAMDVMVEDLSLEDILVALLGRRVGE